MLEVVKYLDDQVICANVAVQAKTRPTPAQEAQKYFFELGMAHRLKVGAALNELGLSFSQAHALRLLDPEEPMPMSALAERLFCDASNVTGIVDRLEARGLVRRESAAGDRRVKALTITSAGMKLREQVLNVMSEPPEGIAALPLEDQRALRDILERAVENLRGSQQPTAVP
jgi:MarR family transcriptional regulator, organic hydroperoxide resistance regulator